MPREGHDVAQVLMPLVRDGAGHEGGITRAQKPHGSGKGGGDRYHQDSQTRWAFGGEWKRRWGRMEEGRGQSRGGGNSSSPSKTSAVFGKGLFAGQFPASEAATLGVRLGCLPSTDIVGFGIAARHQVTQPLEGVPRCLSLRGGSSEAVTTSPALVCGFTPHSFPAAPPEPPSPDFRQWTDGLVRRLGPNKESEKLRRKIFVYLRDLILQTLQPVHGWNDRNTRKGERWSRRKSAKNIAVMRYGSLPLMTYLPDGDIDLVIAAFDDHGVLETECVTDNCLTLLLQRFKSSDVVNHPIYPVACPTIIDAEVRVLKFTVRDVAIDLSVNKVGGSCSFVMLDFFDRCLCRESHLFKRSILLIKAWCAYESRTLGSRNGLIATYALEVLVMALLVTGGEDCFDSGPQIPNELLALRAEAQLETKPGLQSEHGVPSGSGVPSQAHRSGGYQCHGGAQCNAKVSNGREKLIGKDIVADGQMPFQLSRGEGGLSLTTPLDVLRAFLRYYGNFPWESYAMTACGPIPLEWLRQQPSSRRKPFAAEPTRTPGTHQPTRISSNLPTCRLEPPEIVSIRKLPHGWNSRLEQEGESPRPHDCLSQLKLLQHHYRCSSLVLSCDCPQCLVNDPQYERQAFQLRVEKLQARAENFAHRPAAEGLSADLHEIFNHENEKKKEDDGRQGFSDHSRVTSNHPWVSTLEMASATADFLEDCRRLFGGCFGGAPFPTDSTVPSWESQRPGRQFPTQASNPHSSMAAESSIEPADNGAINHVISRQATCKHATARQTTARQTANKHSVINVLDGPAGSFPDAVQPVGVESQAIRPGGMRLGATKSETTNCEARAAGTSLEIPTNAPTDPHRCACGALLLPHGSEPKKLCSANALALSEGPQLRSSNGRISHQIPSRQSSHQSSYFSSHQTPAYQASSHPYQSNPHSHSNGPSYSRNNSSSLFPIRSMNIVDPLRPSNNLGRSVSTANFYRIVESFRRGSRMLETVIKTNTQFAWENFFTNSLRFLSPLDSHLYVLPFPQVWFSSMPSKASPPSAVQGLALGRSGAGARLEARTIAREKPSFNSTELTSFPFSPGQQPTQPASQYKLSGCLHPQPSTSPRKSVPSTPTSLFETRQLPISAVVGPPFHPGTLHHLLQKSRSRQGNENALVYPKVHRSLEEGIALLMAAVLAELRGKSRRRKSSLAYLSVNNSRTRNINTVELPQGLTQISKPQERSSAVTVWQRPSTIGPVSALLHNRGSAARWITTHWKPSFKDGASVIPCRRSIKRVMIRSISLPADVERFIVRKVLLKRSLLPGRRKPSTRKGLLHLKETAFPSWAQAMTSKQGTQGLLAMKGRQIQKPNLRPQAQLLHQHSLLEVQLRRRGYGKPPQDIQLGHRLHLWPPHTAVEQHVRQAQLPRSSQVQPQGGGERPPPLHGPSTVEVQRELAVPPAPSFPTAALSVAPCDTPADISNSNYDIFSSDPTELAAIMTLCVRLRTLGAAAAASTTHPHPASSNPSTVGSVFSAPSSRYRCNRCGDASCGCRSMNPDLQTAMIPQEQPQQRQRQAQQQLRQRINFRRTPSFQTDESFDMSVDSSSRGNDSAPISTQWIRDRADLPIASTHTIHKVKSLGEFSANPSAVLPEPQAPNFVSASGQAAHPGAHFSASSFCGPLLGLPSAHLFGRVYSIAYHPVLEGRLDLLKRFLNSEVGRFAPNRALLRWSKHGRHLYPATQKEVKDSSKGNSRLKAHQLGTSEGDAALIAAPSRKARRLLAFEPSDLVEDNREIHSRPPFESLAPGSNLPTNDPLNSNMASCMSDGATLTSVTGSSDHLCHNERHGVGGDVRMDSATTNASEKLRKSSVQNRTLYAPMVPNESAPGSKPAMSNTGSECLDTSPTPRLVFIGPLGGAYAGSSRLCPSPHPLLAGQPGGEVVSCSRQGGRHVGSLTDALRSLEPPQANHFGLENPHLLEKAPPGRWSSTTAPLSSSETLHPGGLLSRASDEATAVGSIRSCSEAVDCGCHAENAPSEQPPSFGLREARGEPDIHAQGCSDFNGKSGTLFPSDQQSDRHPDQGRPEARQRDAPGFPSKRIDGPCDEREQSKGVACDPIVDWMAQLGHSHHKRDVHYYGRQPQSPEWVTTPRGSPYPLRDFQYSLRDTDYQPFDQVSWPFLCRGPPYPPIHPPTLAAVVEGIPLVVPPYLVEHCSDLQHRYPGLMRYCQEEKERRSAGHSGTAGVPPKSEARGIIAKPMAVGPSEEMPSRSSADSVDLELERCRNEEWVPHPRGHRHGSGNFGIVSSDCQVILNADHKQRSWPCRADRMDPPQTSLGRSKEGGSISCEEDVRTSVGAQGSHFDCVKQEAFDCPTGTHAPECPNAHAPEYSTNMHSPESCIGFDVKMDPPAALGSCEAAPGFPCELSELDQLCVSGWPAQPYCIDPMSADWRYGTQLQQSGFIDSLYGIDSQHQSEYYSSYPDFVPDERALWGHTFVGDEHASNCPRFPLDLSHRTANAGSENGRWSKKSTIPKVQGLRGSTSTSAVQAVPNFSPALWPSLLDSIGGAAENHGEQPSRLKQKDPSDAPSPREMNKWPQLTASSHSERQYPPLAPYRSALLSGSRLATRHPAFKRCAEPAAQSQHEQVAASRERGRLSTAIQGNRACGRPDNSVAHESTMVKGKENSHGGVRTRVASHWTAQGRQRMQHVHWRPCAPKMPGEKPGTAMVEERPCVSQRTEERADSRPNGTEALQATLPNGSPSQASTSTPVSDSEGSNAAAVHIVDCPVSKAPSLSSQPRVHRCGANNESPTERKLSTTDMVDVAGTTASLIGHTAATMTGRFHTELPNAVFVTQSGDSDSGVFQEAQELARKPGHHENRCSESPQPTVSSVLPRNDASERLDTAKRLLEKLRRVPLTYECLSRSPSNLPDVLSTSSLTVWDSISADTHQALSSVHETRGAPSSTCLGPDSLGSDASDMQRGEGAFSCSGFRSPDSSTTASAVRDGRILQALSTESASQRIDNEEDDLGSVQWAGLHWLEAFEAKWTLHGRLRERGSQRRGLSARLLGVTMPPPLRIFDPFKDLLSWDCSPGALASGKPSLSVAVRMWNLHTRMTLLTEAGWMRRRLCSTNHEVNLSLA